MRGLTPGHPLLACPVVFNTLVYQVSKGFSLKFGENEDKVSIKTETLQILFCEWRKSNLISVSVCQKIQKEAKTLKKRVFG